MDSRKTVEDIRRKKKSGQKITMLTAYDYPFASLLDAAGVDIILVGDSLANVVLGLESTTQVGIEEMIYHAKAVNRAVKRSLLVGDMPYDAIHSGAQATAYARRFIEEAGCDAVKLEWFEGCSQVTEEIIRAGIPVMGHVGLTPQTAQQLGGLKVQARDAVSARQVIADAKTLQGKGCFSIVLECIPDAVAKIITQALSIPTIGIGAGIYCDGQVLVTHDLLGLSGRFKPKFVKKYDDLSARVIEDVDSFCRDVESGKFPDALNSYSISRQELERLQREG